MTINNKTRLKYGGITLICLLMLASLGFNFWTFWVGYRAQIYNAGVQTALQAIADQAEKGEVVITVNGKPLTLIKK